jgi:hypothetical protein
MNAKKFLNKNTMNIDILLKITEKDYKIESLLGDLFTFANKASQYVLIDLLSRYSLEDLTFCLPQLVNTSLLFNGEFDYLSTLMKIASGNQNFALMLFWAYSCYPNNFMEIEIQNIQNEIESAIINGSINTNTQTSSIYPIFDIDQREELVKITRDLYFKYQVNFVSNLVMISKELNKKSDNFQVFLQSYLQKLETDDLRFSCGISQECPYLEKLKNGMVFPFEVGGYYEQIVRIVPQESICFKTKTKCPYLIVLETVDLNETLPNPRNSTSKFIKSLISFQSSSLQSSLFANLIETWERKSMKIQETSPFGHFTSWKLRGLIIKSGDNLRKEQFAMQIIKKCNSIFTDQNLSIFLRPFNIIPTSQDSGLIEFIPDALSLSSLKEKLPNCKNLSDLIETIWRGNREEALRNFTRSLAGYSLVSYILNLKDRHNENILIDKDCHLIHIDFGFFFCKSPGSINFETAPFKLTQEMVDVLGGQEGELFKFFESLLISGFLALKKRFSEFFPLIQMMVPGGQLDIYGENEKETNRVVNEFSERFFLGLDEVQIIRKVKELIEQSANCWKTNWYDNFQKYSNNIRN